MYDNRCIVANTSVCIINTQIKNSKKLCQAQQTSLYKSHTNC